MQDRAAAQIELGKLLEHVAAGRQPDSDVTVAQLLDQYVLTAEWDMSTLGKQPRVYSPDHQTCPRVHAGPQDPRPAAGHVVGFHGDPLAGHLLVVCG